MIQSVIGSSFELSLRILLILEEASSQSLDEQQICAIDFISVYASDFDLMDENLHGYGNYRYSEYPARKRLVSSAIKNLLIDGYIRLHSTSKGYCYSITETGKTICHNLNGDYAHEYKIAIKETMKKYKNVNVMMQDIKKATLNSFKEVRYE